MDIVTHLYNFYEAMPTVIQWIGNFLFSVIIIRGIVANEILKEIREKRAWHWVVKKWHNYWNRPRNQAIGQHFNEDHDYDISVCTQNLCATL